MTAGSSRTPFYVLVCTGLQGFCTFVCKCEFLKPSEVARVRFLCHLQFRYLSLRFPHLFTLSNGLPSQAKRPVRVAFMRVQGIAHKYPCAGGDRLGLLAWRARILH